MARRRTRWTRTHARKVVDELERSGLTLAELARARDLHPKRIRVWRKRFEEEAAFEAPRMVELVAVAPPTPCSLLPSTGSRPTCGQPTMETPKMGTCTRSLERGETS